MFPSARLAACLAVVVSAAAAEAEPRQWRDIIYDLPEGWFVGAGEDGILSILRADSDSPCRFCVIQLGPLRPGTTDPKAVLSFQTAVFTDPEDRGTLELVQPPQATLIGSRRAALAGLKSGGDMQVVLAVAREPAAGGGVQMLGFYAPLIEDHDLADATATLTATALPFFAGLRFVGLDDPGLLPPPVPGALAGLWWGQQGSFTLQMDMTQKFVIEQRRIVFWTDGYFYDGTPPGGLAPLDPVALRMAGDMRFGTYRADASALTLHFADGSVEVMPRSATGFADGGRDIARVETLPDGARIEGEISSFSYTGFTPGSGLSGGISSGAATTFRKDGTFTGESFGGVSAGFEGPGGDSTGGFTTQSEGQGGGTYDIRDGLLIQRPAGGGAPRVSMIYRLDDQVLIDDQLLAPPG
jgi:hypothetical protein